LRNYFFTLQTLQTLQLYELSTLNLLPFFTKKFFDRFAVNQTKKLKKIIEKKLSNSQINQRSRVGKGISA